MAVPGVLVRSVVVVAADLPDVGDLHSLINAPSVYVGQKHLVHLCLV